MHVNKFPIYSSGWIYVMLISYHKLQIHHEDSLINYFSLFFLITNHVYPLQE